MQHCDAMRHVDSSLLADDDRHILTKYFTVGRLGEDQIAAYAKRKGQSIDEVERWLTPNLAYEPARC
jgi:hypothetical protein